MQRAYAQALLVDRAALDGFQDANDPLMASQTLKRAFTTDVQPILATARSRKGSAIDPVAAYRASGYRAAVARIRPAKTGGQAAGSCERGAGRLLEQPPDAVARLLALLRDRVCGQCPLLHRHARLGGRFGRCPAA